MTRNLRSLAIAATALALNAATFAPAHAVCPPVSAGNANTTYALGSTTPSVFQCSQLTIGWAAVAIRPAAGEDWDLTLYQNLLPDPTCLSTPLANSLLSGSVVDFVLGDYNYDPTGTYYAGCNRYSGSSGPYVCWQNTPQSLTVNGNWTSRSWGALDLITVWDVTLTGGTTYDFNFLGASGSFDVKLMLFRNPAASTYWVGRSSALFFASGNTSFTAPATGHYAVVVANDNGGTGTFFLRVGSCSTPVPLANKVTQTTNNVYDYWSFTQTNAYWSAVAVRSQVNDYDIGVYGNTAGPGWPDCLGNLRGSSTLTGKVDLVVSDFNLTPTGTYYVYTNTFGSPTGAEVQWDGGPDLLYTNAAPASGHFGPGQIVKCSDVYLTANTYYNFAFHQSGTNLRLLLYYNWNHGEYWATRSNPEFEADGCHPYGAFLGGYYGVVVVNDTGEPADYSIGITTWPCQCPLILHSQLQSLVLSPDADVTIGTTYPAWAVVYTFGQTTADDWDLTVSDEQSGSGPPICIGTPRINSAYGATTVDIGVIDFNHTPLGQYYFHSHHYSGSANSGVVGWDATHGLLEQNAPYTRWGMLPSESAQAWDAYMQAGVTYTIEFIPGVIDQKLMVFENPGSGPYYAQRGNAALTTTGTTTYTPTVSGYHGLIVVSDGLVGAYYQLRFGTCNTPVAMTNGVGASPNTAVKTFSFNQPASRWGAVGVRSTSTDWDLYASASLSGAFPTCLGSYVASSTGSSLNAVDFVVGDFSYNAPGTYYAQVSQFTTGAMVPTYAEWNSEPSDIIVNDNNPTTHVSDASNLLQCYSVRMTAGYTYRFAFSHGGLANVHLLLFRNFGGSTYWVGRGAQEFDLAGSASADYVAPTSGEYGVVVVNDDGADDNWALTIKSCPSVLAIASNFVYRLSPAAFLRFAPVNHYWGAVGVRSTSDWDIEADSSPSGGAPGTCYSGTLAGSSGIGITDFVVGDFNVGANPLGNYYVRPYRFSGADSASVEWDGGADLLTVDGSMTTGTTGPGEVLQIWDVYLNAGQTYGIYFSHTTGTDMKMMVFRNPGGAYWAPRSARVVESTGHTIYTAPSSGYYGVVVVNDNGVSGNYVLHFSRGGLAVNGPATPEATEIRAVGPNPARGALTVEFALHERAPVSMDLIDMAGRRVQTLEQGPRDAGVWRITWNGRRGTGERAAPGVYFVRMMVDGQLVGRRKVSLIE